MVIPYHNNVCTCGYALNHYVIDGEWVKCDETFIGNKVKTSCQWETYN